MDLKTRNNFANFLRQTPSKLIRFMNNLPTFAVSSNSVPILSSKYNKNYKALHCWQASSRALANFTCVKSFLLPWGNVTFQAKHGFYVSNGKARRCPWSFSGGCCFPTSPTQSVANRFALNCLHIVFLSWVSGVSMHKVSLSSRGVLDWEAAGDGAER